MIETEYKARLIKPDTVRERLRAWADAEFVTYQDTYFDDARRSLSNADQELRLRTISGRGSTRHLLTFKEAAVDQATGSKPEYETTIADRSPVEHLVQSLGYGAVISFSKRCENYRFTAHGREVLATVVTVPEIEGTYLELESQTEDSADLDAALADLRLILSDLGVSEDELTTELYTDAVAKVRGVAGFADTTTPSADATSW